jgi:hypothetical protein
MCARRFLIVVFVLILLSVAGAFLFFQYGQRVLISQAVPRGSFEAPPPETAPDYAQQSSWISRPGISGDPSDWRPNDDPRLLEPRPAHLFYIHPTTYLERDRWNATVVGSADSRYRAELFVRSQASAFSDVASVWAPRYRQAAFGAFLLDSEDAQKALDLAYRDVEAAFERFLASVPQGEPIFLAGHSQGALHLTRLLREQVAGKPLRERIVAAYVVGWPISVTADLPAMGLPACETAEQSRCILSWMSFGDPANPELVLSTYEDSAGFAGGERRREDMVCVNPITGTRDGAAPPQANPGTLVPTQDMGNAELQPGKVGARCERGLLIIDGDIPPLGPFVLPGNNYHVYDYALFYEAIRQDAGRRVRTHTERFLAR